MLKNDQLFRTKYGEVLAALLRRFGNERFELVEESVQDAFQKALESWSQEATPDNPGGWLYRVAYNNILESIRREKIEASKLKQIEIEKEREGRETAVNYGYTQSPAILDDMAAMILLCCNPELNPKAQVCLTLKAACGFSVKEIARALGMKDEATKKTISRAKKKVSMKGSIFSNLDHEKIARRFFLVEEALYAMFNEGYAASSGHSQLRREISEDAIRLTDIMLHSSFTPSDQLGELQALMALMLFQFARFDARTSPSGLPIRLQEQNRKDWNQEMIAAGIEALSLSQVSENITPIHLEARIAAEHAISPSFSETNWSKILQFYDQLLLFKDTTEVRLNRIVAIHHAAGWQPALAELDQIKSHTVAQSYLLHAIRADLLESSGSAAEARKAWKRARDQAPTTAERTFIDQKLDQFS